ncbi:MAG: hypothetical protein ACD_39C00676G0001 [uncultured bacterium]|nr:MAG: hypothetical protein ACD_39C00676G0001 [uncultured bacterium]
MPYYLIRFAIGKELTESMQIGFPEAFLTRPLITDGAGKHFLIRLIQDTRGRFLRLEPISLDFSLEKSGG